MNTHSFLANNGIVVRGNFALFWGGVFSNWYKAKFVVDDIEYNTVEQYMMAQKAIAFKDVRALEKIMGTSDPSEQKAHGRAVTPFDDKTWRLAKYPVVVKGVFAKFDQNPHLLPVLLGTEHLIIAEASPYDNQWGIKMGVNDSFATNPAMWNGENLLGLALMDVRATLFNIQDD